jgi:hypothetical protein
MKRIFLAIVAVALLGLPLGGRSTPAAARAGTAPAASAASPLREVSYYPKNYAWERFWQNWAQAKPEMDIDLDRIQALGANTVRIFLHPAVFGYPIPTGTMLSNFEEALALIAAHGLKAHVNLFDCSEPFNEIGNSQTWLAAVVGPHKNDPRIAIWELRNEIGLNQPEIRTWVQQMFPYLKQQAGGTWATLSVTRVDLLDDVIELTGATPPDIYSLHWYPPGDILWTRALSDMLDSALLLVPKEKLLIGEFGLSSSEYSEETQADLYNDVLYYTSQKGITNLGAWTLNDFPVGTPQCNGDIPRSLEWYFGLYRGDGTEKPAAEILRQAFNGKSPTAPKGPSLHNLSFETANTDPLRISNWWSWDEQWTGQTWAVRDTVVSRTGSCSVQLNGPGTPNGSEPIMVGLYFVPALEVHPSLRYNLEAYVRTENLNGQALIVLSWLDKNGVWLGQATSPDFTLSTQTYWERLFIDRAQPPAEAAVVQVFLEMKSTNSATKVWFDDVRLVAQGTYLPIVRR